MCDLELDLWNSYREMKEKLAEVELKLKVSEKAAANYEKAILDMETKMYGQLPPIS